MSDVIKVTITDVRRMLPVGAEFVAEFIGVHQFLRGVTEKMLSEVVKNTPYVMVSAYKEGPHIDECVYFRWKGVTAERDPIGIVLSVDVNGHADPFLRITFPE